MSLWFVKRLASIVPITIGITFICFLLLHALPGDPVDNLVGERAGLEAVESIKRQIGADKPFWQRYLGYLSMMLEGNFGKSLYSNSDVWHDIASRLPNTFLLAVSAVVIAMPVGVAVGFASCISKNPLVVRLANYLTLTAISIPVFCSAILLMLVFALYLKWLPPSGSGELRFLILPAVTLALPASASIARVTKTTLQEILHMPYIKTAVAKGLSPRQVYLKHALKNAIIPIITIVGLDFGSYLNGAVVTETIFGWDGIGRLAMEGIVKKDYPVVLGTVTVGAIVFVFVNALTDLLYRVFDPRVRV